jgi:translation initiation factor 3 subunit E
MADSAASGANVAEQYSLLPKLMPNLDRHLVYPLLNFSSDEEAEQTVEQKKLLLELLKPTNMTDFVGQLHQEVHGLDDMSDEFKTKREEVLKKRDQLEEATSKISGLLDDENVVTNLRSDKQQNLAYLKESHGVEMDMVNQLLEFGQFQYSCGVYPHAAELLYRFRVLVRFARRGLVFAWLTNSTVTTDHRRRQGARSHLGKARLRNPLCKLGLGHGGD